MNIREMEEKYFFKTYNRLPIEISHGEGMYLFSKDGKRYLDMFGGLAVNALGYGNPKIIRAISDQTKKFIHASNYYLNEQQIYLAELLIKYTGYQKVFLCNSGTEAVEGAIKIARKWGKQNNKSEIISFTNSFHGRTLGALSITGQSKYRDAFEPLLPNCIIIPYNDVDSLRLKVNDKTAAVVLEFIQGEGGIIQASNEFVSMLKKARDEYGFLIIADEVQSGLGRTGKLFSFQHFDISPDIVVIAKSLGGGLPLGAVLGNNIVADILKPGDHGSTFGGNPVACAAGTVVLNEIIEGGLMKNAELMGVILKSKLIDLKSEFQSIVYDVRGMGLMLGMELSRENESIMNSLCERGVLINCTNKKVLRFLPPLIIQREHINFAVEQLRSVLKHL